MNPLGYMRKPNNKNSSAQVTTAHNSVELVAQKPFFNKLKTIIVALAILSSPFIGFAGASIIIASRQNTIKPTTQSEIVQQKSQKDTPLQGTPESTNTSPEPISNNSQASPSTNNVYCGVSGMPEGVCTAITSIEQTGLKGNKYVAADTSNFPNNASISINRKAWQQTGPEIGSISFSAQYSNKTYTGDAFFQVINGSWKVISYTLNQ
jgi:cytoskeletal protein RodZ